jgi:hypothetical protein
MHEGVSEVGYAHYYLVAWGYHTQYKGEAAVSVNASLTEL